MDLRGPLAPAAQWFVIGVFAILALAQLGIPTGVLTVLAAVAAAGVALTAALAFGLGGRELARTGAHRIRRNREPRRPVI